MYLLINIKVKVSWMAPSKAPATGCNMTAARRASKPAEVGKTRFSGGVKLINTVNVL